MTNEPMYADVRRTAGGVQFTVGPLPNGQPCIMRLAGKTAIAFADALTANTPWGTTVSKPDADGNEYAIVYEPGDGGGWVVFARINGDEHERVADWGCAAGNLRELGALLKDHASDELPALPGDPPPPWTPEDFHLCNGCRRPVFDSMPSVMVISPSSGEHIGFMCEPCGIRETAAAGSSIDPHGQI